MPSLIVRKILDRIGQSDLVSKLGESLSGTELNSLLLEVLRQQTLKCSAPQLLKHYQANRFVKPAEIDVLRLKRIELDLLNIFKESSFDPLELSPVTVLGACSVIALADQNKILSALRGTEVLADATNAIALHISDLKKRKAWNPSTPGEQIRFATIQRHVRTQTVAGKGFTPHFKIGCLVSAGLDTGSFSFEKTSLLEHVQMMQRIFLDYYHVEQLSFRFLCRKGYADPLRLAKDVTEFIAQHLPEIVLEIVESPDKEIAYYTGLQYKVDITVKGTTYEIGDGGFVDWTQQLLQNKKERFLITGFGFEIMYRIMHEWS
ncbi:MAG TPA: hypothetical protein VFD46_00590 [Chryseolinea sp.]|nr:hypothetical protein [Chryseolinea sp.]